MSKVMSFLNGKKTLIGTLLVVLAPVIGPYVGASSEVIGIVVSIGTMLGGAGIVHKALKADQ